MFSEFRTRFHRKTEWSDEAWPRRSLRQLLSYAVQNE